MRIFENLFLALKERDVSEDFRRASRRSREEGAAIFLKIVGGINSECEITKAQRFRMAEEKLAPATDSQKAAVRHARREYGLDV